MSNLSSLRSHVNSGVSCSDYITSHIFTAGLGGSGQGRGKTNISIDLPDSVQCLHLTFVQIDIKHKHIFTLALYSIHHIYVQVRYRVQTTLDLLISKRHLGKKTNYLKHFVPTVQETQSNIAVPVSTADRRKTFPISIDQMEQSEGDGMTQQISHVHVLTLPNLVDSTGDR